MVPPSWFAVVVLPSSVAEVVEPSNDPAADESPSFAVGVEEDGVEGVELEHAAITRAPHASDEPTENRTMRDMARTLAQAFASVFLACGRSLR